MLRFTIRDLLWLMVVVAVCLAWCNDRGKMNTERNDAAKREADLMSLKKMAQAEANRAGLREADSRETLSRIARGAEMGGITADEFNEWKVNGNAVRRIPKQ
jgi:hypothetical protein